MTTFLRFLVSALGLALAASSRAHLGATLAEATARYGAAVELKSKPPATSEHRFTIADLTIAADFINDTVHRLTYRRPRAFTEEEIQKLLAENAGTHSWLAETDQLNPARAALGSRVWRRSDRGGAILNRHTEGATVAETLILTDATWLMANLELKSAPKPAVPATPALVVITPAPAPVTIPAHALTWTGYDGVHNPAAAHLVLDGQDLGSGGAGLDALQQRLAALPAKASVKIIPYYGDPGGAALKHPPFNLAALRLYCEAHDLTLLVPQSP